MLTYIALIAALFLVGAAVVQGAIALLFQRWFLKKEPVIADRASQQHAAVIISVRGCDPSLRDSLAGLLQQTYASYEVHLIVDHQTDQAWNFVHAIKTELDRNNVLQIHEMRDPSESCSLKCHAIIQALDEVSDNTQLIALLDADVTPHANWLAELTGPLLDPSVGGVTGNQWFEPSTAGIGSLTRSVWNGGAMVPTIIFSNPWAGSFAMRAGDLKKSGLAKTWSHSIVDDGPIQKAINEIGLKIEFAPSLVMVNREPCTFRFVNRWVTRMLTWSRLYEKTFFLSVVHAVFSNVVMLSNFAILLFAIWQANVGVAGISAGALLVSGWLCTVSYLASRRCVARSCELRGESLPPMKLGRLAGVFATVAIAHLVYGISCGRCLLLKQIEWREITYEVKKHDDVKRLNYQPYLPSEAGSDFSI